MVKQKFFPDLHEKTAHSDDKNFAQIAQYLKDAQSSHKRVIPPLQDWHPKHCGKMDLVIKANGEWWHEGQKIQRQSLIELFSRVLWTEQNKFYLKTPVEQIEIEVEDAPLLIDRVDQIQMDGKVYLQFMTPQQDIVVLDEAHPIFFKEYQGETRPYLHVRFGLNALIQRACFYHLVEYGELFENAQGETELHLQSGDYRLHFSA
ncbi:DUF1285 domain-containing protein [Acinetobacter sp. MD2(2019)]|uniref:DUF1285 domain-containing protein n=1 Tax=Acinetobacter sp. MD2(2019) TaxID=2605273 RepID=UPI002D1EE58E|nr:DUF1285 domain-containing protein [Acinetobacter sp. MD2(2019)]MEB3753552.1 DUF1285 domain-containing protein [Acinetobacter sp. MD2(2019)]